MQSELVKDAVWIDSGKQIISCGYNKTARISVVEHDSEFSSVVVIFRFNNLATRISILYISLDNLRYVSYYCIKCPVTFFHKHGESEQAFSELLLTQ